MGHWVPVAVPTLLRASCGQGLPFPPLAQGASQAGVIPLFFCHHRSLHYFCYALAVEREGRSPSSYPSGILEFRQSRGRGGDGMRCQAFAIEEKSCCCLDLSEC